MVYSKILFELPHICVLRNNEELLIISERKAFVTQEAEKKVFDF